MKSSRPRVLSGLNDFRVTDVTSHRNGVSGRRFHSVRFSYFDVGSSKFMPNMLAVIPQDAAMGEDTECFVIDLNDPTSNWRGDNYARHVKAAIDDHEAANEAAYDSIKQLRAAKHG